MAKIKKLSKRALAEQLAFQRGIAAERRARKKKLDDETRAPFVPAFNLEQDMERVLDLHDKLGKPERMTKQQYIDFTAGLIENLEARQQLVENELVKADFPAPKLDGTQPVNEY